MHLIVIQCNRQRILDTGPPIWHITFLVSPTVCLVTEKLLENVDEKLFKQFYQKAFVQLITLLDYIRHILLWL